MLGRRRQCLSHRHHGATPARRARGGRRRSPGRDRMRTSLLFYRRLPSPLHATRAGVGALWAGSLSVAAIVLYHPLVLGALLLAVLGAGAAAGVGGPLARSMRAAAIVWLPIVVVNLL